ncbi:MAG: aspartate aminotransferase family protein [Gemmatimonadetes bacterium]|nr:aspartate aminotransferase family protein [Gemmatimonadota bacterium]
MTAPSLQDHDTTRLLQDAAARASRYLEGLDARPVAPDATAVARLGELDEPMPATGTTPAAVLARLDAMVAPATMAMAGPRFFGFVIGGALPVSVATNWLSTAWDQNTGLYRATPGTAVIERVALRWMAELFGFPPDTAGAFVTGATVANLCGLAAGRHRVLANAGWNVEADGLFGAPPITVIVGEEVHPTVLKALGLLGLGRDRIVRVPVDGQGRMIASALPPISGPTIVVAQAGNLNTGAFDPLPAIIAHAHAARAWVHVDGAFGLWAGAVPALAHHVVGIDAADSVATDAHKWLNVPYDSGITLVKDGEALRAAMAVTASYLPTASEERNPSDYTPELSRRARGVDVWAVLTSLGREGLAAMIAGTCAHARRFAKGLEAAGFEILNEVVLNQVLVSFGSPEQTHRVIAAVQEEGTCWAGPTLWQGKTAMRISVSSWATTPDDVDMSVAAITRVARAVR